MKVIRRESRRDEMFHLHYVEEITMYCTWIEGFSSPLMSTCGFEFEVGHILSRDEIYDLGVSFAWHYDELKQRGLL